MSIKNELGGAKDEVEQIKKEFGRDTSKGFIRKYVHFVGVSIKNLLIKGLTPKNLATGFAMGFVAGTFPLLGTHMLIGVFFAFIFNLNHLSVYLGVWISTPLYILILFPCLRLGEFMVQAEPMHWDAFKTGLKQMIQSWEDFLTITRDYGESIFHLFLGWIPLAMLVAVAVYVITYYLAKSLLKKAI
ncbi:MAG: DUF2062 domain-containing protein [Leptospirales bacterium]